MRSNQIRTTFPAAKSIEAGSGRASDNGDSFEKVCTEKFPVKTLNHRNRASCTNRRS